MTYVKKPNKFTKEYNKTLNASIYYIPDTKISSIQAYYQTDTKIKELYEDEKYRSGLIYIFTYKIETSFVKKYIETFLEKNYNNTDINIYNELRPVISKQDIKQNIGRDRISNIKSYIDLDFKPTNYLDVGCFKGDITKAFGEFYGLDADHVHGVDIKDYADNSQQTDFTFALFDFDDLLPYESDTFDFITILMVLHHVDDQPKLLNEIARVMKKGGILVVREHNLNPLIRLNTHLLDVLHSYYDLVLNPSLDERWTTDSKKEINNYQSIEYYDTELVKRGFSELKNKENKSNKNIFNPFGNIVKSYQMTANNL